MHFLGRERERTRRGKAETSRRKVLRNKYVEEGGRQRGRGEDEEMERE